MGHIKLPFFHNLQRVQDVSLVQQNRDSKWIIEGYVQLMLALEKKTGLQLLIYYVTYT